MIPSVLSVSSEVFPFIKTGGLADVAGALPLALGEIGVPVRTLMPAYRDVMPRIAAKSVETVLELPALFGGPARVLSLNAEGLDLFLLDAPHLFDRGGGPYLDTTGHEHSDNWARFAALSQVAADIAGGAIPAYRPDILHCHDWQAALGPVYVAFSDQRRVKTILTIHNLAFQGGYGAEIFARLGLPRSAWAIDGVEYYGSVGFLKGGLHAADVVTTVSPTYAEEILTAEGGMGLDGLLRGRGSRLVGIVNGIDTRAWNPEADPAIAAPFSPQTLDARLVNKRALEAEFELAEEETPIFCVISRLTWQKGMDVLASVIDQVVGLGIRLVVFGSGDKLIESAFLSAHARHPRFVGVRIGYDEALAHRIQAGADGIIIPSRFEPCGLTQLYALRYGCIPIVSRVGGLADTVINANYAAVQANVATGTIFAPIAPKPLIDTLLRTSQLYENKPLWQAMQRRAMTTDVSWTASARRYADLYLDILKE